MIRRVRFERHVPVFCMMIVISILAVVLVACGSSAKGGGGSSGSSAPQQNYATDLQGQNGVNIVGTYDGFQVDQFTVNGFTCIMMDGPNSSVPALSCNPIVPTSTTTTTTSPF